jgi:ATP-binding cassette subfamily B (MDR/TAP) protein 1
MAGASSRIITMMQRVPGVNTRGGSIIPDERIQKSEILELKNISCSYPTKEDVLVSKNINLKIEKNKVVALVGQSGCGKSSLISLIARFYDPT